VPPLAASKNRHNLQLNSSLAGMLLLAAAASTTLEATSPWAALWTIPCIIIASMLIAWGAESAQFFVAQGFALAILAWMQTLPEFAVEAVLAWRQQTPLLLANLTGALRLLTGLAWPMIYFTAATMHRRRTGERLRRIHLHRHQSVEVMALILPLTYALVIWWKGSLTVYDAGVLVVLYAAYLVVLTKLPPEESEGIEDLETIPRTIVRAKPLWRNLAIGGLFLAGGGLIYYTAEPFLGSLVAVAAALGIPSFVIIQWLAPVISEFPELASTFYFARQEEKAPVALMNIVSSNVNQWTLLVAMLPVVLSLSHGQATALLFDPEQKNELILTIAQSFAALVFLLNMEFAWWEALAMLVLFLAQFALPPLLGAYTHAAIACVFGGWAVIGILRFLVQRPAHNAFASFAATWREHVSG
jgi:cation:H+ antiporter